LVSIVVPALNEEAALGATLDALAKLRGEKEIIVADGGSKDRTIEIARRCGVEVRHSERGRGIQMHTGACAARGDILWFVHADTIPPPHALEELTQALADERVSGGNFGLLFDGDSPGARQATFIYPLLRHVNLCYGDSTVFCRRQTYEQVGGFQQLALFEDLDLLRRLRRAGRFVHLTTKIVTSSRRFEKRQFWAMCAHWSTLQILYWCGADPNWLARHYQHVRRST